MSIEKNNIKKIDNEIEEQRIYNYENNKINNENNKMRHKTNKKIKTKPKITDVDFKILKYDEYNKINEINYNLNQLRKMCKNYKLKVSGNKNQLQKRLIRYLSDSLYVIKIQKVYKGYLVRKYFKMKGKTLYNKNECVNDTDFYTMDKLSEIPHYQYYSYSESENFIYGFDIISIYNLIKNNLENNIDKMRNPYTRKEFPSDFIKKMRDMIRITKILKYPIEINIQEVEIEKTPEEILNDEIIELFARIDTYGFYTDPEWLLNLSKYNMIEYLKQIYDIWIYRAQLSLQMKLSICPCYNGNPFHNINIRNFNELNTYSRYMIKKNILSVIKLLTCSANDQSNRWLGASYCLTALTLVSNSAANALPWLYNSVF